MPIRQPCPHCNKKLLLKDNLGGKRIRCPGCGAVFSVVNSSTVATPPPSVSPPASAPVTSPPVSQLAPSPPTVVPVAATASLRRRLLGEQWPAVLCSLTLLWLGFGSLWAMLTLQVALAPAVVVAVGNYLPPLLTGLFIVANLLLGLRLIERTGKAWSAWPATGLLIGLFCLLFAQIGCHLGADHFKWETTPHWWDWPVLAAVHTCRAGDLLDIFQAYGLQLQVIEHDSYLTSILLVVFHLLVDVFVIALLVDFLERLRAKYSGTFSLLWARCARPILYGFLAVWLISALFIRRWQFTDLLIWPIDNALRVLDVMDVMDLFHVRLHSVPTTWWEGTLTLVCRILLSVLLLHRLRPYAEEALVRWLGGLGLREAELQEIEQNHPRAEVRAGATALLLRRRNRRTASGGTEPSNAWIGQCQLAAAICAGFLVLSFLLRDWDSPAQRLATVAVGADDAQATQALTALAQAGSFAEAAAPILGDNLPKLDRARQQEMVGTLAVLGPGGRQQLQLILQGADHGLALHTVTALRIAGPAAAPVLLRGMRSTHGEVVQATETALLGFGSDAVPSLLQQLNRENLPLALLYLDKLDPYWKLRSSDNPLFPVALQSARELQILQDPHAHGEAVGKLLLSLAKRGEEGLPLLPAVNRRLEALQSGVGDAWGLVDLIRKMGPLGKKTLIEGFPRYSPIVRQVIARQFVQEPLSPKEVDLSAFMVGWLEDQEPFVRGFAAVEVARASAVQGDRAMTVAIQLLEGPDPKLPGRAVGDPEQTLHSLLVEGLRKVPPERGRRAVPALLRKLNPHRRFPDPVQQAIRHMNGALPEQIPEVLKFLDHREPRVRMEALDVLGRTGPAAATVVPLLLEKYQSASADDAGYILQALARIGSEPARVLPLLLRALEQSPPNLGAAVAIGQFGPGGAAAGPAVAQLLVSWEEPPPNLLGVLRQIGLPASIAPVLAQQLQWNGKSEKFYRSRLALLREMGPRAVAAVPAVLSRAGYAQSAEMYKEFITFTGQFDRFPEATLPELAKLLEHSNERVQDQAIQFLTKVSPAATLDLPPGAVANLGMKWWTLLALSEHAKKEDVADYNNRTCAILSLLERSKKLTPALLNVLSRINLAGHRGIYRILGRRGATARVMVPALVEQLQVYANMTPQLDLQEARTACVNCLDELDPAWRGRSSEFYNPKSVVVGGDGRVYATSNGALDRDGDGVVFILERQRGFWKPRAFAVGLNDPQGITAYQKWLFVADRDRVWKIDLQGQKQVHVAADAFPVKPAALNDIHVDPESGTVFVSDSGNKDKQGGAVYRIDPRGQVTVVTDQKDWPELVRPTGLVLDGQNHLLVADSSTGTLHRLNLVTRKRDRVASGLGHADGLAWDGYGRLFISCGGGVLCIGRPGARPELISSNFQGAAGLCLAPDNRFLLVVDLKANLVREVWCHVPSAPLDESPLNLETAVAFPKLQFIGWTGKDDKGVLTPLRPILLTHLGDGSNRLCVATQQGVLHVFPNDPGVEKTTVFLDISDRVFSSDKENEQGVLGLAFHPKFKENGEFFVLYTLKKEKTTNILSRFRVSKDDPTRADPGSESELLRVQRPSCNYNGGTICFGPNSLLYVALGAGGIANDATDHPQNLKTLPGAILRIDVTRQDEGLRYAIPGENPFAGRQDVRPEIWAYGLRNVWRMSFDRQTGWLWAADVGQDRYQEINLIDRGGNYGWKLPEGLQLFGPQGVGPRQDRLDPIWKYNHAVGNSIVGGQVYRGKDFPHLEGHYLYADSVSGKIWALRYDERQKRVTANRPLRDRSLPILSWGEDERGEVYLLTTSRTHQGGIWRLVRTAVEG